MNGQLQAESAIAFHWRRYKIQSRFFRHRGRFGNFETPQSYDEKIQFRKLYGNHQVYALMADKYRVRDYVAQCVGPQYLVPLLGVYDSIDREILERLPDQFVIKANHGCKWHKIVRDKSQLDIDATVKYFNCLMHQFYGRKSGEYHYRLIEPKIIVEKLLDAGEDSPADYNVFCYHHGQEFDYCVAISTPRTERTAHFDKHWNLLDGDLTADELRCLVKPVNFEAMVQIAEKISRGFDFLRVDMYNLAGKIYFGEATCTPSAGFGTINNEIRARMRTDMWKLDRSNPHLYRTRMAA